MYNALHENRSNALVSTETACDMNIHKYKQIPVRVSTKNRTAMVICIAWQICDSTDAVLSTYRYVR